MHRVALSTSDWGTSAYMARSFLDRLFGVWRVPAGSPVLIPTPTVHGFGRGRPLELIGLDGEMHIVARKTLRPNRVIVIRRARMILEVPAGHPLPELGDRVEIRHV